MPGSPPSNAGGKRLYFDNAATSFPKPPTVIEAIRRYMVETGASPGRGSYAESVEAGRQVNRCRDLINRLIHGESADHVVFTLNCTDALNLAIKGLARHHLKRGEPVHVVATWMEHNSILRPLNELSAEGVTVTRVPVDPATGLVDARSIEDALHPHTRLVATIHGSNVTGTLQPIDGIGEICRRRGVPYLVDAAQTIGHLPIDVDAMNIDLLAFPGHKGLLGPLGTGGLYLRPGMEERVETLREGGTGSQSEQDRQPTHMPDRYEPGSHNAPGIIGLAEGVAWILERGVESLWRHEQALMEAFLDELQAPDGLRILGSATAAGRCAVFSVVLDGWESQDLAAVLEDQFGILARAGLHCAPLAHRTMQTDPFGGAVRLSFGPFLTVEDVRYAAHSLRSLCQPPTADPPTQSTAHPMARATSPRR